MIFINKNHDLNHIIKYSSLLVKTNTDKAKYRLKRTKFYSPSDQRVQMHAINFWEYVKTSYFEKKEDL